MRKVAISSLVCGVGASMLPMAAAMAAPPENSQADQSQQQQAEVKNPYKPSALDTTVTPKDKEAKVKESTDRIVVTFDDKVKNDESQQDKILDSIEKESKVENPEIVKTTSSGSKVVESDKELNIQEQKDVVAKLKQKPGVKNAEPDVIVQNATSGIPSTPNDPGFASTWGVQDIRANKVWPSYTGAGTSIGIVDTGITSHPDLNNRNSGYDFVSEPSMSRDGNGRDPYPNDEGDWGWNTDSNWHGTHVSGIAAASGNNGIGVAGVAPQAKIQTARALGAGGDGYVSDMADAIAWSAGVYVPGAPKNTRPSSVVNMSAAWPSGTCPTYLKSAIDQAHARKVPVVVASGNVGDNANNYSPANCLGAVVVGASVGNYITGYSNWGSMVDVVAPGGAVGSSIYSTMNSGKTTPGYATYGFLNGTSMASPHVAGTVALMKQKNPDLTVEQIRNTLRSTGNSVGGYIKIDAKSAVDSVPAKARPVASSGYSTRGAIGEKYRALGGAAALGNPVMNERSIVGGGVYQQFKKGATSTTIYWHPKTGANPVRWNTGIANKFKAADLERGYGYPMTGEIKKSNGAVVQKFFNPMKNRTYYVLWTPGTGTHTVYRNGGIGSVWWDNDADFGYGVPTSDESSLPGGIVHQSFKSLKDGIVRDVVWHSKWGTHTVKPTSGIGTVWSARGGNVNAGIPVTDEYKVANNGYAQKFYKVSNGEKTLITWTPNGKVTVGKW